MGRKKGFKMSQEQKDKIRLKMKKWSEVKECPICKRKNALIFYPGGTGMVAVCRWCKAEFKGSP